MESTRDHVERQPADKAPQRDSTSVPEPPEQAILVTPARGDERRAGGLTPITLLLTLFLAYFLFTVQAVIVLLIVGILLATAIGGPVEYLHQRLNVPRGLGILIMYIVILAGLTGLIYLLVPPVAAEGATFAREFPALLDDWRAQLETSSNSLVRTASSRLFGALNDVAGSGSVPVSTGAAVNVAQGIGGSIINAFTIFLIAFYWLTEKALIRSAVASLFRPGQRRRVLHIWLQVEMKLGAWIRGQLLLMVIIGSLATIAYGAMALPFWLILGVIAGLTEAIPNVGPALGAVPAVLVALTKGWQWALAVIIFVTILQLLENAVLVPRVMKNAVGLTPLTVILAILAGSEFRGVAGALLAVPIAGALSVILGDLLREQSEDEYAARGRPRKLLRRLIGPRQPLADAGATEDSDASH
jgi:predicted PurR-regulated permease PerM